MFGKNYPNNSLQNSLWKEIKDRISSTETLDREFIPSWYSYRDIFSMTSKIVHDFPRDRSIACLYTQDKAVIAASFLATLTGSFKLVLPYALSESALGDVQDSLGVQDLIVDEPAQIPDFNLLVPSISEDKNPGIELLTDSESELLYFFTGGSTQRPKSWPKTPGNLLLEASYQSHEYNFGTRDLFLATVPPYHIYGFLFSVLIPFISSSRVLKGIYTYPEEIRKGLREQNPSALISTPLHYKALKNHEIDCKTSELRFLLPVCWIPGTASVFPRRPRQM